MLCLARPRILALRQIALVLAAHFQQGLLGGVLSRKVHRQSIAGLQTSGTDQEICKIAALRSYIIVDWSMSAPAVFETSLGNIEFQQAALTCNTIV